MLECAKHLVGIRAECNPSEPPISGFYIEDLAGLTFKKIANQSDDRPAVELIKTALSIAETIVSDQILNFIPSNGAVYAKGLGESVKRALWSGWQKTVFVEGQTTETFSVQLKQPNQWQFSSVELGELMVYPDAAVIGFSVDVIDIDPSNYPYERTRTFVLGDLKADFKHYLPILEPNGYPVKVNGSFRIETAQLESINCKKVLYNELNCNTCGNSTETENNYFIFNGNRTFFVSLLSTCDRDSLLCYLYNNPNYVKQLGRAVWYQAGIYLLMDLKNSTRENFYIQNLEYHQVSELEGRYLFEFEKIKDLFFPIMIREILGKEKMCFVCEGWNAQQGIY